MSSLPAIRAALETQLATVSPAISTAYENAEFTPVTGTPYQQVTLLPATPANVEMGPGYTEQGIFQANLFYPNGSGPADAIARAELIRAAFPYAASFVSGGVTVNIIATPEIGPARPEDDRFMVPVKIRFQARIGS
jgi:hypothetical protein